MVKLNPGKVPRPLVHLIPIVEKWALDGYIDAVSNASSEELEALVHCMDDVADDDLFRWLVGPEADHPNPSREYVLFTDLTQAIDLARILLEKRQGREVAPKGSEERIEELKRLVKETLQRF
jgi:succinate dehydrogenase flavin-adding protein (antitoxin of CptAB toxin-antitoxin module)